MIMNIIFDLGGVVVTWKPEKLVQGFTNDSKIQDILLSKLLRHADWIELDRGSLSISEAIKRCSERTGLGREYISRFMKSVPASLIPITDTIELMHLLKDKGHNLFCLSNMHATSISYLEDSYSFLNLFKGVVISCRVNMVKPDPRIFNHLLKTYHLEPAQTVFIDDSPANIEAAKKIGIKAFLFKDAGQCLKALESIGCI
jgi:putative hydrolase of the HAD superfamily